MTKVSESLPTGDIPNPAGLSMDFFLVEPMERMGFSCAGGLSGEFCLQFDRIHGECGQHALGLGLSWCSGY